MLLSTHIERFGVSSMKDFKKMLLGFIKYNTMKAKPKFKLSNISVNKKGTQHLKFYVDFKIKIPNVNML